MKQKESATDRMLVLVLVIILIVVVHSAQPINLEIAARLLTDILTITLGFRAVTSFDTRP